MALAGLRLVSHLHHLVPEIRVHYDPVEIACISAFTHVKDPWTRLESIEVAQGLLTSYLEIIDPRQCGELINSLLRETVRPLFTKSKSNAITGQGRKAINPSRGDLVALGSDIEVKPWKHRQVYVVTVFRWALEQLSVCVSVPLLSD